MKLPLVLATAAACAGLARSDEPLSPPADTKIVSQNHRFYVFMDARRKHTTAYRVVEGKPPVKLWELEGWFRVAALADDGEHFVTGNPGINLLEPNPPKTEIILAFHRNGRLIRAVTLGELFTDLKVLQRTVSHVYWGYYQGLDRQGRYLIQTVDGRKLAFDVQTGQAAPARER